MSGSDIFAALKVPDHGRDPLKVFFFGGAADVAAAAAKKLNDAASGLSCVGTLNPGFGTIEAMSQDDIIDKVNSSGADFLVVSLGARKGQLWLHRNHKRLNIPVRAHLGAVINFEAGAVKRAPLRLRTLGLEWLWRVKEEPHLWRRYVTDGSILLVLLLTRVLPLAFLARWHRLKSTWKPKKLLIKTEQNHGFVTIRLSGDANERNVDIAITHLRETLTSAKGAVVVDLANVRVIDERFLGLLLMVRKCLTGQGTKLGFIGVRPSVRRVFWLNELDFLLNS